MIKKCPVCGKEFNCINAKKYCSRRCRNSVKYYQLKGLDKNDTLCWSCKNACGNCSWSRSFKEVEGWEAAKTKIKIKHSAKGGRKDYFIGSYIVKKCPEYERG